jgi:2-haloacid dehalogenase
MTSLRAAKEGARGGTTGSPTARWATFDCYGTLIDWNGGIAAQLERLWPAADTRLLLHRYHELERDVQAEEPGLSYRAVMRRALGALGDVPAGEEDALAESLPTWNPFPEVRDALQESRDRGWGLAILSNTDRDLVEASKAALGVEFDETVVASEIGSYKPATRHWEVFRARTGADPARHVHVAQSMFHDVVPANELGIPSVWINRLGERFETTPTRELQDLRPLPEVLDELVPAA